MASRLKCSLYTSCEDVKCSDHKPVVAVFHALVNRELLPMPKRPPLPPPRKWRRMQNIKGVYECTLKVDFGAIRWKIHPAFIVGNDHVQRASAASTATSTNSSQRHNSGDKRLDQGVVSYLLDTPHTFRVGC